MRSILLLLFLTFLCALIQCIVYVNPTTGNDDINCGTSGTAPCRTIEHAFTRITAGNTELSLAAGTYLEFNSTKNLTVPYQHGAVTITGTIGVFVEFQYSYSLRLEVGNGLLVNSVHFRNGMNTLDSGGLISLALHPTSSGASVTFQNCSFSNSVTTRGDGGALSAAPNVDLFLFGCLLTNNSAYVGSGGAVHSSSLYIATSQLLNNRAQMHGGAIFCPSSCHLNITEVFIAGNAAQNLGGGIHSEGHVGSLTSSVIAQNRADKGGGISFSQPVNTFFMSLKVEDNVARDGAGMCLSHSFPTTRFIGNFSLVVRNNASNLGGGILFEYIDPIHPGVVDIHGSDISANSALGKGAGAYLLSSNIIFSGTFLEDNVDKTPSSGSDADLFCDAPSKSKGSCYECPSYSCNDCRKRYGTCVLGDNTDDIELCFVNTGSYGGCYWLRSGGFGSGWIFLVVLEVLFVLVASAFLAFALVKRRYTPVD